MRYELHTGKVPFIGPEQDVKFHPFGAGSSCLSQDTARPPVQTTLTTEGEFDRGTTTLAMVHHAKVGDLRQKAFGARIHAFDEPLNERAFSIRQGAIGFSSHGA